MENKGFERESKLEKEVYFSDDYFDKYQLFSLSEQISLVYHYSKLIQAPSILEVGKGNGFVSDFFKKANFAFKTFDINKTLEPDLVGNILDLNEVVDFDVDIILCSEVLEHLDFELFEASLEQLSLTTSKYVIITLPEFKKFFGFNLQLRLPKFERFSIPLFLRFRANKELGSGHFWEIDYNENTSRSNVEKVMQKYFKILEKGRFHTTPYHNYYVLEKV